MSFPEAPQPTPKETEGAAAQALALSRNYLDPGVIAEQRDLTDTRISRGNAINSANLRRTVSTAPLAKVRDDGGGGRIAGGDGDGDGDGGDGDGGVGDLSGIPLLTQAELLVRKADYDSAVDRGAGTLRSWLPADLTEESALEDQIIRLTQPDVSGGGLTAAQLDQRANELEAVARTLRAAGFDATLNLIVPLGYIAKASAGPNGPEYSDRAEKPVHPDVEPDDRYRVGIIDTGITDRPRTDGWLSDLASEDPDNIDRLYEFTRAANEAAGRPSDETDPPTLDLGAGHGTFVAGIVEQVSPETTVKMYKAVDGDGNGSDLDVATAILRAYDDGTRILNLSLGTITPSDQPPLAMLVALEMIAERRKTAADKTDLVIVAAAGNTQNNRPVFPAALCSRRFEGVRVISVAGLDNNLLGSHFSTRGYWVTCSTIGQGILSTFVNGTESLLQDHDPEFWPNGQDPWAIWTGTSFAAPQVAAAIAREWRRNGHPSAIAALTAILAGGVHIPDFGIRLSILPGS